MTASHGKAIFILSPVAHGARDVASVTYGFILKMALTMLRMGFTLIFALSLKQPNFDLLLF